jgi:3-phenylpropionate/trans-cinnamate dioxygenase ferredoxin reductase subunit
MTTTQTIVIVGGNMAGGRAAETLRNEGFEGRVVLIGADPNRPYERPPLSKGYLTGEVGDGDFFINDEGYYRDTVEGRFGTRAVRLDADAREVELEGGERVGYDQLLIATGATPRRLNVEGTDLEGIHYLRTWDNSRAIKADLEQAERIAVVGMGFIGAEIASSARKLGKQVVAIEALELPLLALGREVAEKLTDIHEAHGVEVRTNSKVTGFVGMDRVERVVTDQGGVDCDMVVVGIGVTPEIGWLEGSGVEVRRGVVVDELCRTNLPGVFAAGDVAEWYHPRYGEHIMLEHFDNAGDQGTAAARSMLGKGEPYAPLPYFWTDQYDFSLQYAGRIAGYDQVVWRGAPESGAWMTFYMKDGQLQAVVAVGRGKEFSSARRILRRNLPVTAEQLADEDIVLRDLIPKAG